MRRLITVPILVAVLTASAAAVGGHGTALGAGVDATVRCNGTLPGGTYGNVLVPTGATCVMGGSVTVTGNVKAMSGSNLSITGTSIGKNLQDESGASLAQSGASIGGLELINGLTSTPQSGTNSICGSTIGKDLSVISTGTAAATVVGDTSGVCSAPNTIGRNGKFDRNSGSLDVSDNTFNRNLLVENNSSVPLIVTNNTIGNTCEQHGNPPGSVFSGNKAKRNLGC